MKQITVPVPLEQLKTVHQIETNSSYSWMFLNH